MSKEITKKVKELYDNIMYFPNKVLGIFNDFFGEERVDMQGFYNFDEFLRSLSENKLNTFFSSKDAVLDSPEFKSASKKDKAIIKDMLDNGALDNIVTSDEILAAYFLPIMYSTILNRMTHGFILVHFPHVRITNENDRFVDINHLWVKVGLYPNGRSTSCFGVNRSEYQLSHMESDYMHSHVQGIPFNSFTHFKIPCLGQGPIKNTISTLAIDYDESIWQLFCLELDRYVRVESISGIPHRYLEKIVSSSSTTAGESTFSMQIDHYYTSYNSQFSKEDMRDFIRYLIREKKLKFNFINGSYGLAMSYLEYRILISNEFIKWFNRRFNIEATHTTFGELKAKGILRECIINNGKIEYFGQYSTVRDFYRYNGALVCTFKGNPITIHIVDDRAIDIDNKSVLICPELAESIAKAVLEVVNYRYGREEGREEAGVSTPTVYL